MFFTLVPIDFKMGDTAECTINGKTERVTYRDESTLVIEPDDPRVILRKEAMEAEGLPLWGITCAHAGSTRDDYIFHEDDDGWGIGWRKGMDD